MANAKKLPSGSWRIQVFDYTDENGKNHYRSFTSNDKSLRGKKELELLAVQYQIEREQESTQRTDRTFEQVLEDYIDTKEVVLSPSTIKTYKTCQRMLKKDFPKFMRTKAYDIKKEDVQKVINALSKGHSPKTVRNYNGLISSALGRSFKVTLPQKIKPIINIPTDEELKRLLEYVEGMEIEVPILLGAFCMMRRGEICALTMDDIDGNVIHVHHSCVIGPDKKWHIKAPKTDSSDRYVVAPDFVIAKIREKGYITTYVPESITSTLRKALKRLGIPQFRFHDLRHYSASIRHAMNIPDAYIMEQGGWKTDTVLKSVYRHAMSDRKKEMSDRINSHFSELYHTKYHTTEKKP